MLFDPKQCMEIPEHVVRSAANLLVESDPNNSYTSLLKSADIYKEAEMTPLFYYDPYTMIMYVVAKETLGKKLH